MSIISKIFGDSNKNYLGKTRSLVEKINSLEPKFENFSVEQLKEKSQLLLEDLKEMRPKYL